MMQCYRQWLEDGDTVPVSNPLHFRQVPKGETPSSYIRSAIRHRTRYDPGRLDNDLKKVRYKSGDVISHCGIIFPWDESLHPTIEEMERLRFEGDDVADLAIAEVLSSSSSSSSSSPPPPHSSSMPESAGASCPMGFGASSSSPSAPSSRPAHDYLGLVRSYASSHPSSSCAQFLAAVSTPPPFPVSSDLIALAQTAFLKKLPSNALSLLHVSLLSGFSSPEIVSTLNATGYLTSPSASRTTVRLYETLSMLLDVSSGGAQTFDPNTPAGKGWEATVRVRLLHASVRHKIRRGKAPDPSGSLIAQPISQLHLLLTALTFTINLLQASSQLGPELGFSPLEAEAHIHLWGVVSHYIGIKPSINIAMYSKGSVVSRSLAVLEVGILLTTTCGSLCGGDGGGGGGGVTTVAVNLLKGGSVVPPLDRMMGYGTHKVCSFWSIGGALTLAMGLSDVSFEGGDGSMMSWVKRYLLFGDRMKDDIAIDGRLWDATQEEKDMWRKARKDNKGKRQEGLGGGDVSLWDIILAYGIIFFTRFMYAVETTLLDDQRMCARNEAKSRGLLNAGLGGKKVIFSGAYS